MGTHTPSRLYVLMGTHVPSHLYALMGTDVPSRLYVLMGISLILYVWVFCLHVHLWTICMQRPEGSVGFPRTGVMNGYAHMWVLWIKPSPLQRQPELLTFDRPAPPWDEITLKKSLGPSDAYHSRSEGHNLPSPFPLSPLSPRPSCLSSSGLPGSYLP